MLQAFLIILAAPQYLGYCPHHVTRSVTSTLTNLRARVIRPNTQGRSWLRARPALSSWCRNSTVVK